MAAPIIEIRNLTKRYGDLVAVNNLTLDIRWGEIFGLLGPNGAGKSTTILMMLGLTEPDSGTVRVAGIDSTRQPLLVKRKIGYLPDDVGFYEDMTGLENLLFTARLNRKTDREARAKALELLEQVGLTGAMHKKAGTYSRGMRQRLGLADVLIKDPEVIVLDEPTLGIDPQGVKELLDLIQSLSRDRRITVLLSSHHLHQVQQICDRVGLFVKGQLLAVGDVETLSRQLFKDEPIRITIGVSSVSDDVRRQLAETEGVLNMEEEDGELRFECREDLSSALAHLLISSGGQLHYLHKKTYGLDEIYERYFEGREDDGKPAKSA